MGDTHVPISKSSSPALLGNPISSSVSPLTCHGCCFECTSRVITQLASLGMVNTIPCDFMISVCGSLNVIGPHNLVRSVTIRRYHCVGMSIALLEEVRHCGGGI